METPQNDEIGRHYLAEYMLSENPDIDLTYNDLIYIYENPETGDKDFKHDWDNGYSRWSNFIERTFEAGEVSNKHPLSSVDRATDF